nr:MAG TPA: hypothetical protein [Caudoviricetes sp.]
MDGHGDPERTGAAAKGGGRPPGGCHAMGGCLRPVQRGGADQRDALQHHHLRCLLCGADPDRGNGGRGFFGPHRAAGGRSAGHGGGEVTWTRRTSRTKRTTSSTRTRPGVTGRKVGQGGNAALRRPTTTP